MVAPGAKGYLPAFVPSALTLPVSRALDRERRAISPSRAVTRTTAPTLIPPARCWYWRVCPSTPNRVTFWAV